jgi:CRP/FNR family transcriptional regulator
MMDLVHRPVRERAARLLLSLLASSPGAGDAGVLSGRDLKRRDMAGMIGTTPETLSRVLRDFARSGMITLARDSVRVRDFPLLRRAAGVRIHST